MAEGSNVEGVSSEGAAGESTEIDESLREALGKLVRSKGFLWMAFSDKAAMYWSHAGALERSATRIG